MIRTSLTPDDRIIKLEVPKKYIGKKIEVLVYSVDELNKENSVKKDVKLSDKYRGMLSSENAEQLRKHIAQSRKEWEDRFPTS